jgi:hypothetical protein
MEIHEIFEGGHSDYKWKQLGEYLKGRELAAGKGIKIENSPSSGAIISAKQEREKRQSQAPPFSILSMRPTSSTQYAVELQEGWVIQRKTKIDAAVDSVDFHEVQISSAYMSTRPRSELTLSDGDYAYVSYTSDNEGLINSTPTISVAPVVPKSSHHQPPSGEATGAYGTYYVKLFKLTVDSGALKIIVYQQSDIEHTRLPTFRNVGGERYIHKDWDGVADRYDFRTLEQNAPSGRTYGKVIVDPVGAESLDANDSIKFSAIAEKSSPNQIHVNDDNAGIITIEGNGVDGSLVFKDCVGSTVATLTWEDGLITNPGLSFDIPLGECPT